MPYFARLGLWSRRQGLFLLIAFGVTGPGWSQTAEPATAKEPTEGEMIAAAEKGAPEAMFALGETYWFNRFDRSYEEEQAKALPWYRRAAERGHAESMERLARAYGCGWGVKADGKLALEWALKAANGGSAGAMFMLAEAYAENSSHEQEPAALVDAVKPDDETAVEWFKKAANAGAAEAFRRVAEAYRRGKGVPKSPAKALEWLKRGVEIDDPMTQENIMSEIADTLMKGEGVPKDEKAAVGWLEKLAAKGSESGRQSALLVLGEAYRNGTGVKRDYAKARALFNQVDDSQYGRAKQEALQKLTATETKAAADAAAHTPPKNVGVTPLTWADRTLRAPKGYEMLEPSDVWCGIDPSYLDSRIPNFMVWRMAPGNTLDEVNNNRLTPMGTSRLDENYNKPILRGSEVLGKISLGWVAYVVVADKGWIYRPGEEERLTGVGFVYGAVSKQEALTEAFNGARTKLRELTAAPIAYVSYEAGVVAKPDWKLYREMHTITNGTSLLWGTVFAPDEKTMKGQRGVPVPQGPEGLAAYVEAINRQTTAEFEASSDYGFFRKQLQERYPYWDGHSSLYALSYNTPKPMMPEPVFEIVEETPAPEKPTQP